MNTHELHALAVQLVGAQLGGTPAPKRRLGYDLEVPGRGRTKVVARSHRSTHLNWFRVPDVDSDRFDFGVLVEIAEDDRSVVGAWGLTPEEVRRHARRTRRTSGKVIDTLAIGGEWKRQVEFLPM